MVSDPRGKPAVRNAPERGRGAKYTHPPDGPETGRWHRYVARGSQITTDAANMSRVISRL